MARRFLTSLKLVNLASPPDNPAAGWAYFDTSLGKGRIFNGSVWLDFPAASSGGSGGTNALARVTLGFVQSVVADLGRFALATGVSIVEAPKRVVSAQTLGLSLLSKGSGSASLAALLSGVSLTAVQGGSSKPPQTLAAEIISSTINLAHTAFALSHSWSGSWTGTNNSNGANNGTVATNANTVTQAASGALTHSFAAQVNRTELTITDAYLDVYWQNVAGITGPCTWRREISFDGGATWPINVSGATAFNALSSPTRTTITSDIGQDWAKLTNIRSRITYTGAASATASTLTVDAVRLVVNATRTDAL